MHMKSIPVKKNHNIEINQGNDIKKTEEVIIGM